MSMEQGAGLGGQGDALALLDPFLLAEHALGTISWEKGWLRILLDLAESWNQNQ